MFWVSNAGPAVAHSLLLAADESLLGFNEETKPFVKISVFLVSVRNFSI